MEFTLTMALIIIVKYLVNAISTCKHIAHTQTHRRASTNLKDLMFVTLDYSGMEYSQSFHSANILNSHNIRRWAEEQQKHAQQIFMRYVLVGVFFRLFAFAYCCVSKLETSNGAHLYDFLSWLFCFCALLLIWINCCRSFCYLTEQNICEWSG